MTAASDRMPVPDRSTEPAIAAPPPAPATAPLTMIAAIKLARDTVADLSGLPVDAVSACHQANGIWTALVDVVESPARLGDNDMLATFEVTIDAGGEVTGFQRTARYNRTDAAGSAS